MKHLIYIVFFILTGSFAQAQSFIYWQLKPVESKVQVLCTTNVSKLQCSLNQLPQTFQLAQHNYTGGPILFEANNFQIEVCALNCGVDAINSDLQQTLKANTHPYIQLQLNKIDTNQTPALITYSISIAGIQQQQTAPCKLEINENQLNVAGTFKLLLSDFCLVAPSKFFGLVQVENNIAVNYQLAFRKQF